MAHTTLEAQPSSCIAGIKSKPELMHKSLSICEPCQQGPFAAQLGLFHPSLRRDSYYRAPHGGYTYLVSKSQMEQSSSTGCVWCKLLLRQIALRYKTLGAEEELARRNIEITVGLIQSSIRFHDISVGMQRLHVSMNRTMELLDINLQTSGDDPAAPYITAHYPILDVGSTRTLSLARALIDECVHEHERCKQLSPSLDVRLPSRLVDCTDLNRPRLVSTEGGRGKYLALSYVWGEAQPHKTTTSNISAYHDVIARSVLPQTILDAIYVTHTLGFQYLWADSLCIIQDSDEDKLHEIGRMHLIYRRAHLTIIAASAERVSDGFLQDRPAPPPPEITLPFICPPHPPAPGDKPADVQHVAWGEVHSAPDEDLDTMYPEEPADRRGWCLQELCMSPRVLLFSSKTLRFRCLTARKNVDSGVSLSTKIDIQLPEILLRPVPPQSKPGSNDWRDVHHKWGDLVHLYSKRTLGKASDKLVACGAVAEAFHHVLRCDYLAGVWRGALLEDLLWKRAWDRSTGRYLYEDRPAEYRAPSWSWAAVDGTVISWDTSHGSSTREAVLAKVLHCDVTLKNPELPFGEVTGGSLVLRARLIPCKVRKTGDDMGTEISLPPRREQYSGGLDHVDGDKATAEDGKIGQHFYVDYLSDLPVERNGSDWLVPFWWSTDTWGLSYRPSVVGLIVTLPHTDSGSETKKKVYRRIGMFRFGDDWCWDKLRCYALEEEDITIE